MTSRIVYEPTGEHHCVVTFRLGDNGCGWIAHDHPAYWARTGTVLECGCGATFVAQQPRLGEMFPRWRREGRIARWRRERRQNTAWRRLARGFGSDPGSPCTNPGADLESDELPKGVL